MQLQGVPVSITSWQMGIAETLRNSAPLLAARFFILLFRDWAGLKVGTLKK
jgi:hypothetical protein